MAREKTGRGPLIRVNLQVDPEDFRKEITAASAIMASTFDSALKDVQAEFKKSFQKISSDVQAALLASAKTAGQAGGKAGRDYSASFATQFDLDEISGKLKTLEGSAKARRGALDGLGLDPAVLSGIDAGLEEVTRQFEAYSRAAKDGLSVEEALRYQRGIENTFQVVNASLRETEGTFRLLNQASKASQSANTANFQQETTLRKAQINSEANLQIQQSQRAGRARIEVAKFVFRQVQFFENQLAKAVRGTISAFGSLASGAASGVGRLATVFRRSNRDLNDGFRGALQQREGALSRSFRRQTTDVNREVARQSATLQRFERRASTGLAGIASGRSGVGQLLGAGAAVGVGYKLAQGLRAGFNEAVDLNEAMNAVVQIFGTATDEVVAFTENSVEALFLTQSEALKAAQNFGVFGKSAGLVGTELAGFSNELTLIAADLASFYNTTVPEAVTSVSAALRGESEPIRRYGVLLNEQILKQRALAEGIIDSERQLTPSERVLAAYAEIVKQTAVAQGDAARTADDFANASRRARAASVTTFASIAKVAIPVAEILLKGVIPSLDQLNNFIVGNVGPALQILRTGLIGAAAALGGLLAVRGAIEVIQFLGIALRAVVTPIGLVVTATAALGAAIAILRDRSPEAVRVFDRIREVLTSGLLDGLERLAGLFQTVASFVSSRVLPVLVGLAALLIQQIGPAFRYIADLVENRVLPVFRTIGGFLVAGLSAVLPVLDAVTSQLFRLGQAIGRAFTGDFGGLADIGNDIVGAFKGLGQRILDALVPQLRRAVGFIADIFNGIDWEGLGLRALVLINTIGRILGSIVSDPRFITALAAVAAAGAAVVGSFVLGVGEGIARNIPGLIRLLNDALTFALTEGIKAVFPIIVDVIGLGLSVALRDGVGAAFRLLDLAPLAGLLVAAFGAVGLVRAFGNIGQQGGGSFARGLAVGFSRAAGSVRALFGGLFGPSAAQQFADAGRRNALAYQREFERISNRVQRIRGTGVTRLNPTADFSERDVRRANQALKETTQIVGQGRAGVLAFKGALRDAFSANTFAGFRRNVSEAFRGVNWRQLGQSVGTGFLFGFSAVVAGKQGGTAGLVGVIGSAIAAGVTSSNAYVGLAVGAVGLIAAAWGKVKEASVDAALALEEYRRRAAEIAEIVKDLGINKSIEVLSGELADTLTKELPDAAFLAGLNVAALVQSGIESGGRIEGGAAFDTIIGNLALDPQTKALIRSDFDAVDAATGRIQDRLEELQRLERTNAGAVNLGGAFNFSSNDQAELARLEAFNRALKEQGGDLQDLEGFFQIVTREIAAFGAGLDQAGTRGTFITSLTEDAKDAVTGTEDLTRAQRDLIAAQEQSTTQGFFDRYFTQLKDLGLSVPRIFQAIVQAAKDAGESIDLSFLASLFGVSSGVSLVETTVLKANSALEILRDNIESFRGVVGEAEQGTTEWQDALDKAQQAESALRQDTSLLQAAIESLNQARTDAINVQIDNLTTRLDGAKEAAELARESLTAFITGDYQDTTAALVDDLIGNLTGVGESIAEAQKKGGAIGAAEVRSIFGDLDADIAGIVQAGFDEGLNGSQIKALLDPLNAAIGEVTNPLTAFFDQGNVIVPKDVTDRIFDQIQRKVDPKQIDVNAGAIFGAEAEVERMQRQLDAARAALEIEVKFNDDQIAAELQRAGLDRRQVELVLTTGNTDTLQGTSQEQAIANFQEAFANVALLFLNANAQAPAGGEVNNNFTLFAPGNDPEQIADTVVSGLQSSQVQAAGGTTTTPRINVVYNPFANAGSNAQ